VATACSSIEQSRLRSKYLTDANARWDVAASTSNEGVKGSSSRSNQCLIRRHVFGMVMSDVGTDVCVCVCVCETVQVIFSAAEAAWAGPIGFSGHPSPAHMGIPESDHADGAGDACYSYTTQP